MKRGRPPEQPAEVKEKYTRVVKHSDGSVTTWFYDLSKTKDGPIKTETKYPKGMLDWGQVQESLPKTKRKYALDDGRIVGYTRARELGVI